MKRLRKITRKEKKKKYKTPARWEESRRKQKSQRLNIELNEKVPQDALRRSNFNDQG